MTEVIPPSLELKKPAVIKYLEPVLMPSFVVLHLVCRKKLLLLLDLFEGALSPSGLMETSQSEDCVHTAGIT